jgi:prolyl-tRNA synthetase
MGEKGTLPLADAASKVPELLETIQQALYLKADKSLCEHHFQITEWDKVVPTLDAKNLVLIPHYLTADCEDSIKELTTGKLEEGHNTRGPHKAPTMGMKSLYIPFEQPEEVVASETECLSPKCKLKAWRWCTFGRNYYSIVRLPEFPSPAPCFNPFLDQGQERS